MADEVKIGLLLAELQKELGADSLTLTAFSSPGEPMGEPYVATTFGSAYPREAYVRFAEHLHEHASQLVCEKCGCCHYDPCEEGCSWSSMDPPLCSFCSENEGETAS